MALRPFLELLDDLATCAAKLTIRRDDVLIKNAIVLFGYKTRQALTLFKPLGIRT